ncbi:MAG: amidohydrolase family protein [Planctomycetota bacterium]
MRSKTLGPRRHTARRTPLLHAQAPLTRAAGLALLAAGVLGQTAWAQDSEAPGSEAPGPEAPGPEAPGSEAPAAASAAEEPQALAIRAARVVLRPGQVLENATVVVEGRRITAIGADVEVPEGARVLEGDVVCAGFIDPWSVAGLDANSARATSSEAFARAADAVDPYSQEHVLDELVRAGVLATRSIVGARAPFGGLSVFLRTADAQPLLDESALHTAVGVGGGFSQQRSFDGSLTFGFSEVDPLQRLAQIDKIADQLRAGAKYGADRVEYELELAEWQKEIADKEEELQDDFKKAKKDRDKKVKKAEDDGKEFKEKKYKEARRPKEPRFDPEKAVFARVVNGELPLVVRADRALEIWDILKQTAEFDRLRLVVAGGRSALACARDLVARDVPVIVTPSASAKSTGDSLNRGLGLAGDLHAAGIEVLIGSGGSSALASRDLPLLAALAVGHGLDADAALHAITRGPAQVFDLGADVGTLRRGRAAELIVLSGNPLSSSTRVLFAVSNGEVVHSDAD